MHALWHARCSEQYPIVIRRVFKAFQYRDFRLMWIGACTSSIGTWMQIAAQSWLVLKLSNSPFLLGLDAFLGGIPIFLFSLVGGVVADRIERRKVLLISQIVQMSAAFLLTILISFDIVRVWQILCLSFITGFAQAFGGPAYQALIPTLVEKEDMPNAIALQSIQFNVARVIGPALGGIALTQLGEKWCFGLNGISFFAPIISLLMLKTRFYPQKTSESILAGMKQGIGFIRNQSAMVALMVLAFCMTALGVPMLTFLPVFAKDIFHQGPGMFTMFLGLRRRLHCGRAHRRRTRQCAPQGSHRTDHAYLPRCRHCRVRHFLLGLVELPDAVHLRRLPDCRLYPSQFARPTHHHERNARPRDERLQLRLPRRHADGKPVDRLARPTVFGAPRASGERTRPHGGRSVLPRDATAGRRSLM
jgi:Transmembrane secretion effector